MTTELGEAQIPIRATLDKLDGDLAQARGRVEGAIQGLVGNIQKIGGVALGIGGVGITAIAGIGAAVGKMAIDAAPVEGLAGAFAGLADSAGVGMDDMLAALKKGSAGMVANRDLMMSFNQAASLVSLDFAKQLPDAMSYLGKVSASTGQDMGFLLDSLVKGVGRLSPMILDNLAIQVSQSEATARAAEMFGVEEEALTKAQVQAGMMNVVLEKLAANTASMPDVSESAAAKMAQLKATFQDTKDQIGMAFLPVLSSLAGWLNALIPVITPLVDAFVSKLVPALDKGMDAFGGVRWLIEDLISGVFGRDYPWEDIFPPEIANIAYQISGAVFSIIDAVAPYVEMAIQWISENVELKDVLIALGIAIASVVVPAVLSIIGAVAPVIATFVALVAIVAALRQAWETDWMGIRTALAEFWENTAKPALEQLWAWLQVNIPAAIETLKAFWANTLLPAIQTVWSWMQASLFPALQELWNWLQINIPLAIETLKTFWENTLLPAIQTVWSWMQESLFPALQELWEWLETNIPAAIETLRTFWEETLLPAIQTVWAWIQDNLVPLFEAVDTLLGVTLSKTLEALAGLWQNVLQPALEAVWGFIQDSVIPVVSDLAAKISKTLQPVLEWLSDFLNETLKKAFDGISAAIEDVTGFIKGLAEKIGSLKLPDWLTPGSPTPFELALRGIGDEMERLATVRVPALQTALAGGTTYSMGGIYGPVHLHGVQSPEGFLEQMRDLAVR